MPTPVTGELVSPPRTPRILGPIVWVSTALALLLDLCGVSHGLTFRIVAAVALTLSAIRWTAYALAVGAYNAKVEEHAAHDAAAARERATFTTTFSDN